MHIDRRRFLVTLAGAAGAWSLGGAASVRQRTHAHAAAAPEALRLALLHARGAADGAVARGAALGAAEAEHAARLLGRAVTLARGDDARALLADARPHVLLACDDGDAACAALAGLAAAAGALVLNVACASDASRARCHPLLFHVAPSDAQRRHAEREAGGGAAAAWHPTLERFGAAQLNDRWRALHGDGGAPGDGMPAAAWPAWMAVKIAWETALRAGALEPARLAARLRQPATRFDGHKGRPLAFAAHDHQLVQPMYVVTGTAPPRVVEVAPAPAPAGVPACARDGA